MGLTPSSSAGAATIGYPKDCIAAGRPTIESNGQTIAAPGVALRRCFGKFSLIFPLSHHGFASNPTYRSS